MVIRYLSLEKYDNASKNRREHEYENDEDASICYGDGHRRHVSSRIVGASARRVSDLQGEMCCVSRSRRNRFGYGD
mgnify:CR=1 FL=1